MIKLQRAQEMKTLIPIYVEVSFGNACNFKCMYCSILVPKWMEEIKQHGPYPTSDRYNNLEWIESLRANAYTK